MALGGGGGTRPVPMIFSVCFVSFYDSESASDRRAPNAGAPHQRHPASHLSPHAPPQPSPAPSLSTLDPERTRLPLSG